MLGEAGINDRATVLIDKEGKVLWSESVTPAGADQPVVLPAHRPHVQFNGSEVPFIGQMYTSWEVSVKSTNPARVVLHLSSTRFEVVDLADVYYLEARGDATRVRLRGRRARLDVRPLGDLAESLDPGVFHRIHRGYMVNLSRVRMLRRRSEGRGWEVRMEPPVNAILPVGRGREDTLLAALEA